ncbi:response regulator [Roseiterribacter gracilis]|uniref:DNA-binding response regulator n=1 Tax=Roseiterribacter gracilis TaxID=2812848 RepID=A0A8S8XE95_9PROT|nr:DNA-binding response regulator [Rhodospirillales bacterium TMPK1]
MSAQIAFAGFHTPCAQVQPRVMIVDADRQARSMLATLLTNAGFRVTEAANGRAALTAVSVGAVDLVVLEHSLPGEDGLKLCRELRAMHDVSIVMLSNIATDMDRIVGLELGADDYLCRPCNPRELLARIRAVLRRVQLSAAQARPVDAERFRFDGWNLDLGRRQLLSPTGANVSLSGAQLTLLHALVSRPMKIVTRETLNELVTQRHAGTFGRSVDVQISRLRSRLGDNGAEPRMIKTVRFTGYVFALPVEALN